MAKFGDTIFPLGKTHFSKQTTRKRTDGRLATAVFESLWTRPVVGRSAVGGPCSTSGRAAHDGAADRKTKGVVEGGGSRPQSGTEEAEGREREASAARVERGRG